MPVFKTGAINHSATSPTTTVLLHPSLPAGGVLLAAIGVLRLPLTAFGVAQDDRTEKRILRLRARPDAGCRTRRGCPPLDPEQWHQAERSQGGQQAEARQARLAIGKEVGVDSLDEIVTGGGNQNRFCPQLQNRAGAGGLGNPQNKRVHVGHAHDGGQGIDSGPTQVGDRQLGRGNH